MNPIDDNTDSHFRKLFEKAGLENPSPGFTDEVMKKIAVLDPEVQPETAKGVFGRWLGYAGIALLAITGLGIMYYFGIEILPEGFKLLLSPVFSKIFDSFRGIFDSMEISNTTIAIILGFAFLVILERIFNKLRLTRHFHFSF